MNSMGINVAEPALPPLSDLLPHLESIWSSRRVTNGGPLLEQFESALANHLGLAHVSVLVNGTMALLAALDVLDLTGEVITTPFTFIATTNVIRWRGLTPVFADIDPVTLTLDPNRVEAAITPRTRAILAVHVYGRCAYAAELAEIAERHGLQLLYDGAHAFGVTDSGGSTLRHGDAAVVSFHATKVLNTLEGGGIVCKDAAMKARVEQFKNFGLSAGLPGARLGINGKMNELQAAIGLLQLPTVHAAIAKRRRVNEQLRQQLASVPGVSMPAPLSELRPNFSYFPVFISAPPGCEATAGRDRVRQALASEGISARPYFHPLTSNHDLYCRDPSAARQNLPVANRCSDEVLCLPIHTQVTESDVERICAVIARTQTGVCS